MQALINQIPPASKINNYRVGDSQPGQLLNTAGYGYLVRNDQEADHVTGKIDYNLSTKMSLRIVRLESRLTWTVRTWPATYSTIPPVSNNNDVKFAALSWRFSPDARR